MKSNPKKISEERILQIANDIAEDMGSYTKVELVQCVTYFQDELCKADQRLQAGRSRMIVLASRFIKEIIKV